MNNIDELIKALRGVFGLQVRELCADDKFDCDKLCKGNILTAQCIIFQAADAIEALQAELKPFQDAAAEYGIDAKTMLTLAKSQIATAQENISLRAERDALLKAVEKPSVQERGD